MHIFKKSKFFPAALLLTFLLTGNVFSQSPAQDSLRNILILHDPGNFPGSDTVRVNTLNQLALTFHPSDPDSLLIYAQKAYDAAALVGYKKGMAESLRYIGVAHYAVGSYDQALDNYYRAAELSEQLDLKGSLASNYNNIAIIHDIRGNNEAALDYYTKSLAINRERNNERGIAYNLINTGLIYHNLGRISQALDTQMEALKIVENLGDKNGMALALNNIGSIYNELGRIDDAIEKHRESLSLREEINDRRGMSSNLYSIGFIHMQGNRADSASWYFDKSLKLSRAVNDLRGINKVLVSQGDIASNRGELEQAEMLYLQALETGKEIGDQYITARINVKLALIETKKGNLAKALELARKGRETGKQIDNMRILEVSASALSEIYEALGDTDRAFSYFREAAQIADSLNNFEIQRRAARLDADYEYFQREKEWMLQQQEREMLAQRKSNRQTALIIFILTIALFLAILLANILRNRKKLQKAHNALQASYTQIENQKSALEKQAEALTKANKDKSRLFSVISHDMKGPLAYAFMAIEMMEEKGTAYREKTLPLIRENIVNVYNLMDNLLEWSRIQMNSENMELTDFDLYKVIIEVNMGINNQISQKGIKVDNQVQRKTLVTAERNITELVLRNLLTNAIKFSHQGGKITVFSKHINNHIEVCIEDQGMGINPKEIAGLFEEKTISKPGTANEKGSGIGLKLSKELLEKINGRLWIDSASDKGTRVWFSLPAAANQTSDGTA
ncbi:MAG: hypothetical protein EA361_05955 [Bacteroidetes bacterium]|nr:MAG: hypothetical protein EA361_05955 [Bacteroidota bacterium]